MVFAFAFLSFASLFFPQIFSFCFCSLGGVNCQVYSFSVNCAGGCNQARAIHIISAKVVEYCVLIFFFFFTFLSLINVNCSDGELGESGSLLSQPITE